MKQAQAAGLDLVAIAPDANPIVCKLLDYKRYCFDQAKKQSLLSKQKAPQIKELQFGLFTGEQDYQVKLRNAIKLFEKGKKIKILVIYKGRESAYKDRGFDVLKRFESEVANYAIVEQAITMGHNRKGSTISMLFRPRGKNAKIKDTQGSGETL